MTSPELSYEEAREQLVEIVRKLEAGSVPLSESMTLWAVSYTHLDVYKRQCMDRRPRLGTGVSVMGRGASLILSGGRRSK